MRRAARTDSNHADVRDGLRALHVWVHDTSGVGGGFPDLLCWARGRLVLLEVKTAKGKLTPEQVTFHGVAKALGIPVFVVRDLDEAVDAVLERQNRK